jgi:hypothetical protein
VHGNVKVAVPLDTDVVKPEGLNLCIVYEFCQLDTDVVKPEGLNLCGVYEFCQLQLVALVCS